MNPARPKDAIPRRLSVESKIDLCRGLFALLVVVAHGLEVTSGVFPDTLHGLPGPMAEAVRRTIGTGLYYVMGFFVISGFCIHLSVDRLQASGAFQFRAYLIARLTRILPLYYVALLVTVLVEGTIGVYRPSCWPNGLNGATLVGQLLCVQNLTQTYGSFASSWSITNELIYYVLYGVLLVVVPGRPGRAAWAGMGLCVVCGGVMLVVYRAGVYPRMALSVGLLFGLGANWYLGALIAVYRDRLARSRGARALAAAWPLVLAAAMALWASTRVPLEVVYLASGLAFALMLVGFLACVARGGRVAEPAWAAALARSWGLSSYPTYLFHGPALMLFGAAGLRWGLVGDWRVMWVVVVASGALAGWILGHVLEAPILASRARLLRRLRSPAAVGRPRLPILPGRSILTGARIGAS
jgi:peptidoglycan/LPS O-acetylase OafA/YrhL